MRMGPAQSAIAAGALGTIRREGARQVCHQAGEVAGLKVVL